MGEVCHPRDDMDDEDVELEHTPLFNYMRECDQLIDPKIKISEFSSQSIFWEKFKSFTRQVKEFGRRLKNHVRYNEGARKLSELYRQKIRSTILSSTILLEDDVNFLENVMCDDLNDVIINEKQMFTSNFILHAIAVGCWGAVVYFLNQFGIFETNLYVLALPVAFSAFSIGLSLNRKRQWRRILSATETFVKVCEECLRCSNKCLTYLRELEVYGRGLLLPVPEFSLSRMENSSLFVTSSSSLPKMCALNSLRRLLYDELKKLILFARSSMFQLIRTYPTNKFLDNDQNYVAYLNAKEIDALLNNHLLKDDEITITILKCLFQLFHLHLSEFLRRFCLCFSNISSQNVLNYTHFCVLMESN